MILFACDTQENNITELTNNHSHQETDEVDTLSDDLNRIGWQKPQVVLDMLGSLSDKAVLEIGAGTGYFTFRLVPRVKKLIATDIDSKMTHYLDSIKINYLPENMRDRLHIRMVEADDSGIEKGEVDVVFISNTYAYIQNRADYLNRLKQKLKNGDQIIIIDYKMREIPVGPNKDEKIPLYKVEEELKNAGLEIKTCDDTSLPYQYIIISEVK